MTRVDRYVSQDALQIADAGIDRDAAERPAGVLDEEYVAPSLTRADLVFYGVAHGHGSYEARVFFNNPDAGSDTPLDHEHGYAGSFYVFGHDHCYGGPGHCNPSWGQAQDALDYRRPHHMEPYTETVTVTEPLRRIQGLGDGIRLTVVAIRAQGPVEEAEPPMDFEHVRLLTYA